MEKNELPCWVALSIIAGLVLVGVFIWQFPEDSSEWAVWVQAIGSIGAIATAIFIMKAQVESQETAERRRLNKSRKKTLEVLHRCTIYMVHSSSMFLDENGKFKNDLHGAKELELVEAKLSNSLSILRECISSGHLSSEHTFKALKAADAALIYLHVFKRLKTEALDDGYIKLVFGDNLNSLRDVDDYLRKEIVKLPVL